MPPSRDPIERAADGSHDLHQVATWEPRSLVDRLSVRIYRGLLFSARWVVILVALAITASLFALGGLSAVLDQPLVGVFVALSAVPALLLAAYIWYTDITTSEPLRLLVATFVLAVLFAAFAGIVNSIGGALLEPLSLLTAAVYFYLIVAPVEETVKLLAVRFSAYRSETFDAVIDGAIYGAVAGLGFATIENAIYIARVVEPDAGLAAIVTAAAGTATVRGLVGPGHVIYSAIAGYYLGLAKFNREHAGPLVVKGLLVAAFVHATYNLSVGTVPPILEAQFPFLGFVGSFLLFVIVYDAAIGYYLYRLIKRYRQTYRDVGVRRTDDPRPEGTEFDA